MSALSCCRQVPTYLLERKLQLAQEHEALMAAKAAAAIPPGACTHARHMITLCSCRAQACLSAMYGQERRTENIKAVALAVSNRATGTGCCQHMHAGARALRRKTGAGWHAVHLFQCPVLPCRRSICRSHGRSMEQQHSLGWQPPNTLQCLVY